MKRHILTSVALLLALCLCASLPAEAYAEAKTEVVTDTVNAATIFDPDELTRMVEGFIESYAGNGVRPERLSIAYTYLDTGETWFYNPDTWYYSASMYKVPLMMILAQKEADGELTQESNLKGISLAFAEESILVYSNNDYAHLMLSYLGTDQQAREMYKQFSSLPDDYYHPDFIDYSYFTARFMNDVMTTLYQNPERFPHIIDCLKLAQPVDYFHLCTDPSLVIAQKYGSYHEFNHTTGIIYTPHPILLTVMTSSVTNAEEVIARAAQMFVDYTLTLDEKLDAYLQACAQAEQEAQRKAEEAAEEEARQAQEAARLKQQEQQRQAEQEAQRQKQQAEAAARKALTEKLALSAGGIVAAAVLVFAALRVKKRRGAKAAPRSKGGGGYRPRH